MKVNNPKFNINTVGFILMILGAVGLAVSFLFWNSWAGFGSSYQRRWLYRTRPGDTVVEEHHEVF